MTNSAYQTYRKNLTEAEQLLHKISLDIKTQLHTKTEQDINWSNAGSAGRTLELTKDLADFLEIRFENWFTKPEAK